MPQISIEIEAFLAARFQAKGDTQLIAYMRVNQPAAMLVQMPKNC